MNKLNCEPMLLHKNMMGKLSHDDMKNLDMIWALRTPVL